MGNQRIELCIVSGILRVSDIFPEKPNVNRIYFRFCSNIIFVIFNANEGVKLFKFQYFWLLLFRVSSIWSKFEA